MFNSIIFFSVKFLGNVYFVTEYPVYALSELLLRLFDKVSCEV